ncbi:Serine/threonine protein kinase [Neorhodopirellula lusitana]|uniref:Serine/threonine protein kinase n=1 Tax=Neorhodopirellula lusitana TaxID=445327 RepID=A0ABY1QBF8_9BACT|nr:WD40 repeat domain-containing serine/threonine protein kinase [Neorhodopirellula lusitana]SMP65586.1 Serine/threonine protein kinase [Neorhodopirellula lusitana]
MPEFDDLFDKARNLSSEELHDFLARLTDEQRSKVQDQLLSTRDPESEPSTDTIIPDNDPYGTIEPNPNAPQQKPKFIPLHKRVRSKAPSVPSSIGPYKILQPIGEGGMGQVFMAEQQEPVKRRVALKIINTETPSDKVVARFEAERQALAMMDHQNIAKVLDAGITDDGRPYFAMELVKGIPITEYCDRNRLTASERLGLFMQTCRAIQHAHQKGIIHRDLKPSNVLVTLYDGNPVAKVIDFGLAKAINEQTQLTSRTLFTQYGQVVGTLEYMSPEQAELNALDVDTKTDVYSLGIIMYELLTGSTPIGRERLRSEAFDRILAIIREEEAPRPSARLSNSGDAIAGISEQRRTDPKKLSLILKGDLDWIAMKAIEKDRSRRYDGPAALADDVQRFLSDEPIEARPPTVGYRFNKAIRKHKAEFLTAAAIVGLLITGLFGTGLMWLRAVEAEEVAVVRAEAATKSKQLESMARAEAEKSRDRTKLAMGEARAAQVHAEQAFARSQFNAAKALFNSRQFSQCIESLSQVPEKYRHVEWYLARERFFGSEQVMEVFKPRLDMRDMLGGLGMLAVFDFRVVAFTADGSQIVASDPDTVHFLDAGSGKLRRAISIKELDSEIRDLEDEFGELFRDFDDQSGDTLSYDQDLGSMLSLGPLMLREEIVLSNEIVGPSRLSNVFGGQQVLNASGILGTGILLLEEGKATSLAATYSEFEDFSEFGFDDFGESDDFVGSFVRTAGVSLVTSGLGERVQIIDGQSAKLIQSLPFDEEFNALQADFSEDGTTVALLGWTSGDEGFEYKPASVEELEINAALGINRQTKSRWMQTKLLVWDLSSNEIVQSFVAPGKSHFLTGAAFDPSGTQIAVTDTTGAIRLYDWKSGELLRTLLGHTGPSNACFSPDGSRIASVGLDGTVRSWNLRTTDHALKLGSIKCLSLAFGPEGRNLALGCIDGTIRCWNVASRKFYKRLTPSDRPIDSVNWSPDGKLIASLSPSQRPIMSLFETGLIRSGDSQEFVAGRESGIDPSTPTQEDRSSQRTSALTWLFGLPANDWLFGSPTSIRVMGNRVVFSPDGTLFADTTNTVPRLLDPMTGKQVIILEDCGHEIQEFAFAPDGKSCAAISPQGKFSIWDVATGKQVVVAERPQLKSNQHFDRTSIHTFAYSPSGEIAFPSKTHSVEFYDPDLEKPLVTFEGHSDTVTTIAFSADGSRMVTGSLDNTIKIWDTSSQEELFSLPGHATHVRKVAISPDGGCIASLGDGGMVKIWDARSRAVAKDSDGGLRGNGITGGQTVDLVSDPRWRMKQVNRASESGNAYAEAFHLGWQCEEEGVTDELRQRLRSAIAKLSEEQRAHLPPFIEAYADKD